MPAQDDLAILQNDARLTREAVIRMEGKLDNIFDKVKDLDETMDDHESRLRELEKSRWPIAQISVFIAFLALLAAILIPLFL